jgi:hypothetical protein
MAIDFNALRARKGTNFQALQNKLEKTGQNGGYKKDERIWKPAPNKDNKSSNIIRFLPIPFVDMQAVEEGKLNENDLTPMAKIVKHAFQGPKGWYIENSLQTFGEDCPVRKHDGPLWNTAKKNNDEILKTALKKRLPNSEFYANILVIKDGTNPENNGKQFLYQFGETVRKLIEKANKPEFDTDPSFDPFDAFEGADLLLNLTYDKKKIGEKEFNVANFQNVKWAPQRPLADGNEQEIERIWKAEYSIAEFYDRKNFKGFAELEAKYLKVMGIGQPADTPASTDKPKSAEEMLKEMSGEGKKSAPAPEAKSAPAPEAGKAAEAAPLSGDDDAMAEFERMLAGN